MKAKQDANRYDKIFKENLESVTLALVEKVIGIAVAHYEKMPLELQRTVERKPDQLLKITDRQNRVFLLQLEFQLADEPDMVYRMLEYRAMLTRKHKLLVRQYVFFLSDAVPAMPTNLVQEELSFGFHLIRLSQIDYTLFLSSEQADEVVFAVLGNLGGAEPAEAVNRIIERLRQTSGNELSRHLQQLRILATLRKLSPLIEQIMESILQHIREEDDYLFKKGIEQGIEQGVERGIEQGIERGVEKGKRQAIANFLKAGVLTTGQLASLFEVSETFVEKIRRQLDT